MTHAFLQRRGRREFFTLADEVIAGLGGEDGFGEVLHRYGPLGREVWTVTTWRDADGLQRFVVSGAHGRAMRELSFAIASFRSVRFDLEPGEALSWKRAMAALEGVPLRTLSSRE